MSITNIAPFLIRQMRKKENYSQGKHTVSKKGKEKEAKLIKTITDNRNKKQFSEYFQCFIAEIEESLPSKGLTFFPMHLS